MTKDNKTPTPSSKAKSTPPKAAGAAAPRKKLTLNTTAFQKKLSSISVNNILDEEPDYEKMPSLAQTKRNREKQKTKYKPNLTSSQKIVREVDIPIKISIQELASRMSEKTGDVVKALMKNGIMATANQFIDGDTAELIVTELGHTPKRETAISLHEEIANLQKTTKSTEIACNNQEIRVSRAPIVFLITAVGCVCCLYLLSRFLKVFMCLF